MYLTVFCFSPFSMVYCSAGKPSLLSCAQIGVLGSFGASGASGAVDLAQNAEFARRLGGAGAVGELEKVLADNAFATFSAALERTTLNGILAQLALQFGVPVGAVTELQFLNPGTSACLCLFYQLCFLTVFF